MATDKQQEVPPPPPPPLPAAANTDEESQTVIQSKASRSSRKKCVLLTSLFIIFITVDTVVFLTFDRIFFGVRTPEYRLQSVTVQNLLVSSTSNGSALTPPPTSLNMQLNGQVTLMNRNLFDSYRFHDEYLTFSYGGKSVGEAVITGTRVNARSTKTVAFVSLNLTSKTGSRNSIKMTAFSELKGQVRVLNLFPKNKSAKLNCDLSVNFVKEIVEDLICH